MLLLVGHLLGCTNTIDLDLPSLGSFRVTFVGEPELGTAEAPLDFSTTEDRTFSLNIEALRSDQPALIDTSFSGMAVITVLPTGKTAREPHWVQLEEGRALEVPVSIRLAYGPVRLVASDPGYLPAENPGAAACVNGLDDDGDGYVDAPDDRGCYYANDQSETGGSGAVGLSPTIFIANPRLADVQRPGANQDEPALRGSRVTVDQGLMLVTRVSTDGLYVTDFDGAKWDAQASPPGFAITADQLAYRSAFAYNFSTPLNLNEGDCLVQLDGTVEEFYGYTELGKPTWKKGDFPFCAALARQAGLSDCPAEESDDAAQAKICRERLSDLANTPVDLTRMVLNESGVEFSVWDKKYLGAERYEAALVQLSEVKMFTEIRYCDRNGNGVVDYTVDEEKDCSNDCGDDPRCIIGETYDRYKQWTVHFEDGLGAEQEISVVSLGALPHFDPLAAAASDPQGRTLSRVIGTTRNLSFGRPRWIVELRRPADCPDCTNTK